MQTIKADFSNLKDILQTLKTDSVFDIINNLTKSEFIKYIDNKYGNAFNTEFPYNPETVYDLMCSFGNQINNRLIEWEAKPYMKATENGITEINFTNYQNLFSEPWHKYCHPSSLESTTSPVSYLVAIYKIASSIEKKAGNSAIKLIDRRPDLKELILNEKNTYNEIPTISLVNEILEKGINQHIYQSSKTLKDNNETKNSNIIWKTLAEDTKSPIQFPFNLPFEKIKNALDYKSSNFKELEETINFDDYIINGNQDQTNIPLSTEQIKLLLDDLKDGKKIDLNISIEKFVELNNKIKYINENYKISSTQDIKNLEQALEDKKKFHNISSLDQINNLDKLSNIEQSFKDTLKSYDIKSIDELISLQESLDQNLKSHNINSVTDFETLKNDIQSYGKPGIKSIMEKYSIDQYYHLSELDGIINNLKNSLRSEYHDEINEQNPLEKLRSKISYYPYTHDSRSYGRSYGRSYDDSRYSDELRRTTYYSNINSLDELIEVDDAIQRAKKLYNISDISELEEMDLSENQNSNEINPIYNSKSIDELKELVQSFEKKENIDKSMNAIAEKNNVTNDELRALEQSIEDTKKSHNINNFNDLEEIKKSILSFNELQNLLNEIQNQYNITSLDEFNNLKNSVEKLQELLGVKSIDELKDFETFCEKLNLKSQELEELFFIGKYKINQSEHLKIQNDSNLPYIFLTTGSQSNIQILENKEYKTISDLLLESLFRIQKLIRLKNWLNLSIWETHLLLTHILKSKNAIDITNETLKSISYFIHLKHKFALNAENYVSWVDEIPTYSTGNNLPWFDSIFNKNLLANTPLLIENSNFDFSNMDDKDGQIIKLLLAGLNISFPNLQHVASLLFKYKGVTLSTNIDDISALYRSINISRTFGFSSLEGLALYRLLGYSINQLKDQKVIHHIETISTWIKGLGISPIFLEAILTRITTTVQGTKEILDFINTTNTQVKAFENQSTQSNNSEGEEYNQEEIKSKLVEIADKILLPLIESIYKISQEYIPLIFKWIDITSYDLMNQTINQQEVKSLEEINQHYLLIHNEIARHAYTIKTLNISTLCLKTFIDHPDLFELTNTDLNLKSFYTLWVYNNLASLPANEQDPSSNVEENLLNILSDINKTDFGPNNFLESSKKLAKFLDWDKKEILSITNKFGITDSILKIFLLFRIKTLTKKTWLSAETIIKINSAFNNLSNFDLYQALVNDTIYSYSDDLEKIKRDILVSLYLKQLIPNNPLFKNISSYIKTPNNLYEYLLIDNQVSTEVTTTPVASAIASLQQFINGVSLNIEPDQNPPKELLDEWESNNDSYSIWSANMQLQNYPENYIEPSLRFNKSEYFKELENTINQNNINQDTIQKAVLSYLNRFEQISDLKVLSGYVNDIDIEIDTEKSDLSSTTSKTLNELNPKWNIAKSYNSSVDNALIQNTHLNMIIDYDKNSKLFKIKFTFSIDKTETGYDPRVLWITLRDKTGSVIFEHTAGFHEGFDGRGILFDRIIGSEHTMKAEDTIDLTFNVQISEMWRWSNADDWRNNRNNMAKNTYSAQFSITPEILKENTTKFSLSNSKCYLISKSRQEPREYYVRFLDLKNSIDGTPNPWAWNDYQKIDLPLNGDIIETTIQPVYYNKRLYIMWAEWSNKSQTNGDKEIKLDVLDLKIGYQAFDGTWSAPQTLVSSTITNKSEFKYLKGIALQINNTDTDKRCIFVICKTESDYSNINDIMGCIIDKNFNVSKLYDGAINIDNGELISQHLKEICKIYKPKMLQMKSNQSLDSSFKPKQILKITIENYKDINDLGTSQFLQFDQEKSFFNPVRLNTTFVKTLVGAANLDISNLLTWNTQLNEEPRFSSNSPKTMMDFDGANGRYFYELFFHMPFLIATRLKMEQKYKEAKQWIRFVFDPAAKKKDDGSPSFWNTRPLTEKGHNSQRLNRPTDVDSIASSNPIHYKKAVFYLYMEIIISEADDNYRLLTQDGLTRAKQLYIQALALLGKHPDINLINRWEEITLDDAQKSKNNKLRAIETAILTGDKEILNKYGLSDILNNNNVIEFIESGSNPTLKHLDNSVFSTPLNSELLNLWDTIESRLDNLRNNRSIDGKVLSLSIFDTPMNPKDLLIARGAGGSSALSIARLSVKVPPYRFSFMIEKAHSAVDTLIGFGEKLLGYLERKDETEEQEIDQSNVIELSNFAISLQEQEIKILEEELKSISISKTASEAEHNYYSELYNNNLSLGEITGMALRTTAAALTIPTSITSGLAEAVNIAPNTFGLACGGMKFGAPIACASQIMGGVIDLLDRTTDIVELNSEYESRRSEWKFQAEQAKTAVEEINQNLIIQKSQIKTAQYSLTATKREQSLMKDKYLFYKKRFTNKELYQWLIGQITPLYFQMYDATVYMCLAAEACYRFESGDYTAQFIETGGWNNFYKGLCVGERLKLNLHKMEVSRAQKNERPIEIEHTVLLSEIFGPEWDAALENLKKTGEIRFEFSEKLFAQHYPGFYYRQIYYMSISMKTNSEKNIEEMNIHSILTQTSNSFLLKEDNDAIEYLFKESKTAPSSDVLLNNVRQGQRFSISKTVEDYGINCIKDDTSVIDQERYYPFEGVGLISKWHLNFTSKKYRDELLSILSDVSIKIRYTAIPGTPQFTEYVKNKVNKQ